MNASITQRDLETLSAYLDGELSPAQFRKIETRLSSDQNLRAALEELRNTRRTLCMAPRLRAPRNFTLTPELAGVRQSAPRLFNAMRLVSVVASFLFVVTVAGDYLANNPILIGRFSAAQAEMPAMESLAYDDAESNVVEESAEMMDKAAAEVLTIEAPVEMPQAEIEEIAPAVEPEMAREEAIPPMQAEGLGGGEGDFDPSGDSMPGGGGMGASESSEPLPPQPTMTTPAAAEPDELDEEQSAPEPKDGPRIAESEMVPTSDRNGLRILEWSLGLIALSSAIVASIVNKKDK